MKMIGSLMAVLLMAGSSVIAAGPVPDSSEISGSWKTLTATPRKIRNLSDLRDGKNIFGRLGSENSCTIDDLTITLQDGALVIDTRAYHAKYPGARAYLWLDIPGSLIVPGKKAQVAFQMSAQPACGGAAFAFGGARRLPDGSIKQYWNEPQPFFCDGEFNWNSISAVLPKDLEALTIEFNLTKPAVYRVGKGRISYPAEPAQTALPKGNQLINGGAELGLYSVYRPNLDRMGTAFDHSFHDIWGKVIRRCLEITPDDKHPHSGKYSFRIEQFSDSIIDQFRFNDVKFFLDRPICLSFWAKAEKNNRIEAWLAEVDSTRYTHDWAVGPEWQHYTLVIPKYGKEANAGWWIGNRGTDPFGTFNLAFLVKNPGVVWLDDVSVEYALTPTEPFANPPVNVFGTQAKSFVHAGEPIVLGLSVAPLSNRKSAVIEARLTDVYGKTVYTRPAEKVTLPFKREFSFDAPAYLRGPVNVTFDIIMPDGSHVGRTFLSGVLDTKLPQNPRIGANVHTFMGHNPVLLGKFLKEFRVGSLRLWMNALFDHPELDTPKIYHENGFYILYCLACASETDYAHLLPKDPTPYLRRLEAYIKKVTRGNVDAYEIFNEPNAWNGDNKRPDKYIQPTVENIVAMAAKIRDVIRKNDPGAKIAGPATCQTSIPWVQTYLEVGGKDIVDIVTEHPYRSLPELPDYGDELQSLQCVFRKLGRSYPVFSSEFGTYIPGSPLHNMIADIHRKAAAESQRMALIAFANGSEKYFNFCSGVNELACKQYVDMFLGDTAMDYAGWMPAPALYALRNLADRLENAKPVRKVAIGSRARCYIFDRGDKRVAALWKWSGPAAKITFPTAIDCFDFVGSRLHGNSFDFGPYPLFIESAETADGLEKLIRSAKIPAGGDICEITTIVTGNRKGAVRVRNLGANELSGTVELETPVKRSLPFKNLQPETAVELPVDLPRAVDMTPQEIKGRMVIDGASAIPFTARISGIVVPKAVGKITIDGDLREWDKAITVCLNPKNTVSCSQTPFTEEERKISAEAKFLWDANTFYVAVIVHKNKFQPVDSFGEAGVYQGDSVQIAFDTLRNAPTNAAGYQDDDFEYAISLFKGEPMVYRANSSSAIYDSLMKKIGRINEVPTAIRHQNGTTVYEMAFPTFTVSPFKLRNNSACRGDILVNIGNGKERRGWLELTPGIGKDPKNPGSFSEIILTEF